MKRLYYLKQGIMTPIQVQRSSLNNGHGAFMMGFAAETRASHCLTSTSNCQCNRQRVILQKIHTAVIANIFSLLSSLSLSRHSQQPSFPMQITAKAGDTSLQSNPFIARLMTHGCSICIFTSCECLWYCEGWHDPWPSSL